MTNQSIEISSYLSIIVVNYNTQKFLYELLKSIYLSCEQSNLYPEIIVIDNASFDGSSEMIAENFHDVVFVQNSENLGFGAANNIGVKKAKGEYLLLLNPDTIADKELINETLKFFEQHPENKSAFGGILLNPDGTQQRGSRRSFPTFLNALLYFTKLDKILKYKKAYDLSWLPVETHEVECVSGACIGMPKVMYEKLGGFDERFFLHFEDIDLCKKIQQAGYKLWFYPEVKLFHEKGASSNSSQPIKIKVNKWFLDSLGKYLWKWDKPSAIIFNPILGYLKFLAWFKILQLKKS